MIGSVFMKKGFTLIELLAVIVILALVLAIAVPTISKLIETSQAEAYHSSEQLILKSAKLYAATNQSVLPQNIGDTTSVLLSDLVSANYLSNITDPYDQSNCSGYITIIKTDVSQFEYTPHIHCDSNINSTTEDQLVYHYKFDDFQEPTTNLFVSLNLAGMRELTYQSVGMEDGWHKYTISGTGNSSTYPYSFNIVPMKINSDYSTSVSFRYKTTATSKFYSFATPGMVNIIYKPGMTVTDLNMGDYRDAKLQNISPYTTVSGDPIIGDVSQPIYFQSRPKDTIVFDPNTDFVYFKNVQVERKSYSTPYVEGSRTGIIKDYSGNNKTITLAEATTPRWVNDAQQKGTYYFDGVKTSFQIPDPQLTQNVFTLNFWMNPSSSGSTSRFLTPASTGIDQYLTYEQSSQRMGLHIAEAGETNERNIYSTVGSIPTDQWTMVTLAINGQTCQIYINGKLNVESVETIPIALWASHWTFGQRSNNTYFYKGYFDDIRLYKRALSENEIRNIYNGVK